MTNARLTTRSIMAAPVLFLDSSAAIAGVISSQGASRALLVMAESELIDLVLSEQVIAESERNLARKAPAALPFFRETLRRTRMRLVPDPSAEDVAQHLALIAHEADVPIALAAMHAGVDYIVTLNRRHFLDDSGVAERTGLRIGTPGDALMWVRDQLNLAT